MVHAVEQAALHRPPGKRDPSANSSLATGAGRSFEYGDGSAFGSTDTSASTRSAPARAVIALGQPEFAANLPDKITGYRAVPGETQTGPVPDRQPDLQEIQLPP